MEHDEKKKKAKKNVAMHSLKFAKKKKNGGGGIQEELSFSFFHNHTIHMHILNQKVRLTRSLGPVFWLGKICDVGTPQLIPTKLHIYSILE